ncbi:MAG: M20 family metallopeptidase, partial [Euryarchaeota archaeon]|nr:M20 family metallopeptidase [Euryarchaeota archaeon]
WKGSGGIVFSGHLDTVPIGDGWTRKQGEVEGDRVYGRGTADMKGAVASILHAAADLASENIPCAVLLTTDEEEKMLGALELSTLGLVREARVMVICEPTNLRVACKEKGVFRFRLVTRGRAAHSSQSWLGDNAILRMHALLSRLLDLARTPAGPTDGMTMCYSTIRGGTKNNVVPDRCETEIDARFPAPLTPDEVEGLVRKRLAGEQYELETIYGLEAFQSDPDSWAARELAATSGTKPIDVPYATEAPRYAAANPSIYIFGPGDPALAHVADEHVEISKLTKTREALVRLGRIAAQG